MVKGTILLTLLIIIAALPVNAQEFSKPDFTSIENTVKDPNSIFYYPTILKKYMSDDTTLSDKEYWMLYYGYFFHEDNDSLDDISAINDSLRAIKRKKNLDNNDWSRLIHFSKRYLKISPFHLETLNLLYIANKKLDNADMVNVYRHKLGGIIRTILASGDGRTENSGYFVLQVSDEYAIISILGYEATGSQSLTTSKCDYLTLDSNKENLKGLYFDVKQIFKGYERMFMKK